MAIIERGSKGRFQRVTPATVGPRIKPVVTVPAQRDGREAPRVVYTTTSRAARHAARFRPMGVR